MSPPRARSRPRPWALLLGLAAALAAAPGAGADAKKVYRYETKDGRVDYGTEVPPGAVILGEVGEVRPAAPPAPARLAQATDLERLLGALAGRPVAAALLAAGTSLWAVLLLRLLPGVFRTRALDLRRAARLAGLVLAGALLVAVAGLALEWAWSRVGWSPRAELGGRAVALLGAAAYAAVVVIAFRQRLGVGLVQAVVLGSLWVALVAGAAALAWIVLVPAAPLPAAPGGVP